MNLKEHLLTILAEEAVEVALAIAQRASKANRFGVDEVQLGQDKTNAERVMDEVADLMGIVRLCQKQALLPELDITKVGDKQTKIMKFLQHSRECGTLNDSK